MRLRPVEQGDLPVLYGHQCDPLSNEMAVSNPRDADAFNAHWTKIIADPAVVVRAVVADGRMVGYVSCFKADETHYVGYWIDRDHWGRGIAKQALALLLEEVTTRPLYARVARSNVASLRVLERCGFSVVRFETCEATERHPACEEAIMILT